MGIIITNEVGQTDEWRDRHMDRQTETGQNRNIGYKNQLRQCPSDTGGAVHTAIHCVVERRCTNPVDFPSLDTGHDVWYMRVSTGPSALRFPETVQERGRFGGNPEQNSSGAEHRGTNTQNPGKRKSSASLIVCFCTF